MDTKLEDYRVSSALGTIDDVFYIPNFISPEEESFLIKKIQETPLPRWKTLPKTNRRLQLWGGQLSSSLNNNNHLNTLISEPMPSFITSSPDIITKLVHTGVFRNSPHKQPNHIIMNEYLPGQGIMPHLDGPAYYPTVATISLGSHTVFHYYHSKRHQGELRGQENRDQGDDDKNDDNDDDNSNSPNCASSLTNRPVLSILLEPRSVVISRGAAYESFLHGIDAIEKDRFAPAGHTIIPTHQDRDQENRDDDTFLVPISSHDRIQDLTFRKALDTGGEITRGVRYSLTCRDVEVVKEIPSGILNKIVKGG